RMSGQRGWREHEVALDGAGLPDNQGDQGLRLVAQQVHQPGFGRPLERRLVQRADGGAVTFDFGPDQHAPHSATRARAASGLSAWNFTPHAVLSARCDSRFSAWCSLWLPTALLMAGLKPHLTPARKPRPPLVR